MNKRIVLIALCVAALCPAFAQTSTTQETVEYSTEKYKVETNGFWDNWFISAGGGAQIYFGDHDRQISFGKRLAPAVDVAVGKWFSPSIGMRLMYSGFRSRGATQDVISTPAHSTGESVPGKDSYDYYLRYSKFNMHNAHADVLFNLVNIIGGYKESHKWDFSLYAGVGYAWVPEEPKGHEVSANIGALTSWSFCKAMSLDLDVRGMFVNDRFDGEGGGRFGEGNLSAALGLTYKFKERGWNRAKTIYRNTTTYDYGDLESLRRQLDEATAANERLQKALADGDNQKAQTIVKKVTGSNLVTFQINKSKLSNEARVNLGMLAEVIKSGDPEAVYIITGYADAGTGSVEGNVRLSRERADAVYDCLVNEFGVDESQLRVEYKGGVDDMFYNDPRLSRAVITRAE